VIGKKVLVILLIIGVILETSMAVENKNSKKQAGTIKPFPTEICEVKTKEDLLEKCVGKRVKINGTMAKTILKHPNLTYPDISSMGGYTSENHIDTQWGQLGLISQKPIKCQETVEIEGILRVTSLADEAGKDNYKVPYVQVLVFQCK